MKTVLLIVWGMLACLPTCLLAQNLTKEELKRLQAELKALAKEPQKLKAQKTENEELAVTENMRNVQYIDLKAKYKQSDTELKNKDEEFVARRLELDKINKNLQTPQSPQNISNINKNYIKSRAFYRIQIGAYLNPDLAKALQMQDNFSLEEGENGMKRYMVGKFVSFQEASKLKEKLCKTGAQAYVVGYLDDNRLTNLKDMPVEFLQK